jgi:hypothetical protein
VPAQVGDDQVCLIGQLPPRIAQHGEACGPQVEVPAAILFHARRGAVRGVAVERSTQGRAAGLAAAKDRLDLGQCHETPVLSFGEGAAQVHEAHDARNVEQGPWVG